MISASVFPWNDRAGRFSLLKAATLALCLAPAMWLVVTWFLVGLGSRPVTYAIHVTGEWAVRFLLLGLLVSPLRRIADWPSLILVRRMLGLAALGYVVLHVSLYVADLHLDLLKVASEIARRLYLTIGFAAFVGLLVLGATSTDASIRKLGAERWNRLHTLVYVLTALALVHYAMQRRLDVSEPVMMAGFFIWLMGYRALQKLQGRPGTVGLALLTAVSAASVVAIEVGWYGLRNGVAASRLLDAQLAFDVAIRPVWWVLLAGLILTIVNLTSGGGRPSSRRAARLEAIPAPSHQLKTEP